MLKYKTKLYAKFFPLKWMNMNYNYCKQHLDFNKFTYKDGHKVYVGPSQEVRDLFKEEKRAYKIWNKLKQ